jgi:acetyl esterase
MKRTISAPVVFGIMGALGVSAAATASTSTATTTVRAPSAFARSVAAAGAPQTGTFVYGTDSEDQVLEAWWDEGDAGKPWVVLIHGGSWRTSHGGRLNMELSRDIFRAAGFNVFSLDYRGSTEAPWPAQRLDVANAILYIKGHATQFGIAADRGAAYGFSAGAHLAQMMGTIGVGSSRLNAIVAASPPSNPKVVWDAAHDATDQRPENIGVADWGVVLARTTPDTVVWPTLDAGRYITPDDAPEYITHADDDPAVPVATSVKFDQQLTAAGVPHTFLHLKTGGHYQRNVLINEPYTDQMVQFVQYNTSPKVVAARAARNNANRRS